MAEPPVESSRGRTRRKLTEIPLLAKSNKLGSLRMVTHGPAQQVLPHCSKNLLPERPPALFVASDFCRRPGFGRHHPLAIPRVSAVLELCGRLGWLDAAQLRTSRVASVAELAAFHDPAYVDALRTSDAAGCVEPGLRERYGFGNFENPLFPGVFERAATAVGG
ncbi:MAG: hypothetical protein OEU93_14180, partial [Rubrivivax sp.]|nr:hypothetical protein [Rubrivivax sp.]